MDLSRLRPGELIAGAGGVALLVVMFLDWYAAGGPTEVQRPDIEIRRPHRLAGVRRHRPHPRADGARRHRPRRPDREPPQPGAAGRRERSSPPTLGALATLLVLYRILNQPGPNDFIEVKLGAFLGFLAVLAIAAGGYRSMRDEAGEERADADRRAPGAGAPRARATRRRRPRPKPRAYAPGS